MLTQSIYISPVVPIINFLRNARRLAVLMETRVLCDQNLYTKSS
jgi:hypothetical protein